jgi:hypothetical protein
LAVKIKDMTAKEAYEKTRGITAEVDSIIALVKISVNLGEYKTVIQGSRISPSALRKLKEMGYMIREEEGSKTIVSWNHFL